MTTTVTSLRTISVDVAVIGAGTAGMSAYRSAKALGKRVVLIESHRYGTTCARVGCMPSKLLIAPADALHATERLAAFGITMPQLPQVDRKAVMQRVQAERDRFVSFVIDDVGHFDSDDKIIGQAQFIDNNTLQIDQHTRVNARSIVIATGSTPVYPAPWASLGARLLTTETVFELEQLPDSVAVFGPGVIGLELGQALARLGVRVKVFGRGGGLAGLSDASVRDYAKKTFANEFYLDTDAQAKVSNSEDGVAVEFRGRDGSIQHEDFDYVLAATGRKANVRSLHLSNTSLALDGHGVPLFDRTTLRCGDTAIFIAGDVNEDLPLLHEAADEGGIAGANAAHYPIVTPGRRRAPLAIVFTDPQIAVVGNGWRHAQTVDHVTGVVSFEGQGRSRVMLRNQGLLHVYVEKSTHRFVGAEMIGPDAEHIGHLLAWALQMNLSVDQMLDMPFYHPVIQEGLRTALRDAKAKIDAANVEPQQAA